MSDWKCKCGHVASAHHVRTCLGDQFCACREFQGEPNPPAASTVPRVASSLDDLRVGQRVALDYGGGRVGRVDWVSPESDVARAANAAIRQGQLDEGLVIILADPPPSEPVSVSRHLIDELAEAANQFGHVSDIVGDDGRGRWSAIVRAARALVAEVRAQEPTP